MSKEYTKIADPVCDPNELSIAKRWAAFESVISSWTPEYRHLAKQVFYLGFIECWRILSAMESVLTEREVHDVLTRISEEANAFADHAIAELERAADVAGDLARNGSSRI